MLVKTFEKVHVLLKEAFIEFQSIFQWTMTVL